MLKDKTPARSGVPRARARGAGAGSAARSHDGSALIRGSELTEHGSGVCGWVCGWLGGGGQAF